MWVERARSTSSRSGGGDVVDIERDGSHAAVGGAVGVAAVDAAAGGEGQALEGLVALGVARASDSSLSAEDVARLVRAPRYVPQPPVCQSFCPLSVGLALPWQFSVGEVPA